MHCVPVAVILVTHLVASSESWDRSGILSARSRLNHLHLSFDQRATIELALIDQTFQKEILALSKLNETISRLIRRSANTQTKLEFKYDRYFKHWLENLQGMFDKGSGRKKSLYSTSRTELPDTLTMRDEIHAFKDSLRGQASDVELVASAKRAWNELSDEVGELSQHSDYLKQAGYSTVARDISEHFERLWRAVRRPPSINLRDFNKYIELLRADYARFGVILDILGKHRDHCSQCAGLIGGNHRRKQ